MDYRQQAADWDQWIRDGLSSRVRQLCRKLNHKSVPRDILLEYAQIARRVGAPDLIVAWYGPLVRSAKPLDRPVSDQERALYGLGLSKIGAFREAEGILREIPPSADPQINFYQASLHVEQWSYRKAIPYLKKYVRDSRLPPYAKLVGRLNLCAALVTTERVDAAEAEISGLRARLTPRNHRLLLGNLLEIRSQLRIKQRRFNDALLDLDEASHLLQNADERSRIYVDKWKAIINLKLTSDQASALNALQDVKRRALQAGSWEVVRDCDLQTAIQTGDETLLARVYWGTPFAEYKNRIRRSLTSPLVIPREFIWSNDPHTGGSPPIDLVDTAPTPALKRLFHILTREFYRPLRRPRPDLGGNWREVKSP